MKPIISMRQPRFIVSHQLLSQLVCGRAVVIHYSLPANVIYIQQANTALRLLKVGVSLRELKAILTVEAAGLRGCGR